ncbi:MAG: hypothetical protein AAGC88_05835 [Bacteroidota bacterium]
MKPLYHLVLVVFLFVSHQSFSQPRRAAAAVERGWEVLGTRNVSRKVEKDVLRVGANDGAFTKLKVKITGGTVYMARMVVTYGNGTKDEIPLKYVFKPGAESRVIDLRGGKRVISKITFIYDRRNVSRSAKIWVGARR